MKNLIFFALAATGKGISGSDRIFIEFAKRWSKKFPVQIWLTQEGLAMCQRQGLVQREVEFKTLNTEKWENKGFSVHYLIRILYAIKIGLTLKMENNLTIVYSASEFWMDSLPAFILKLRLPKIKWVAAWYQTAPLPWRGFAEGKRENRHYLSAFAYWLVQLPIAPIISNFANIVLVNNNEEVKRFPKLNKQKKAIVVLGGVNVEEIREYEIKFNHLPKIYDAVFQGRFHPQKGVLELVDIWKLVVKKKDNAKLVMIGDGPLFEQLRAKIDEFNLNKNIFLTGYLFDGEKKYKVFSQSKIVVHPSFYDSGGMATAEAMAFGLPAVGFDLISFRSYYPQGLVKIPVGDLEKFSQTIIDFLQDDKKRKEKGKVAKRMINNYWSWNKRAEEALKNIA